MKQAANKIETLWQEAETHRRAGRLDEAEAGHKALLAHVPDSLASLQFLASRAAARREHSVAAAYLRRFVVLEELHAGVWYALGGALLEAGDAKGAADAFEQAVRLEPLNRFYLMHLAAAYHAISAADANVPAIVGLALSGLSADQRAGFLEQAGTLVTAVATMADAEANPAFDFLPVPYAAACQSVRMEAQAERLMSAGNSSQAYAGFMQALSVNPKNKRALAHATDIAFGAGDAAAGLKHLRALTELSPGRAPLLYRLAVIEEQVGDPARARRAYLDCLRAGPGNALAYLFAGAFFEGQGDPATAAMLYSLGEDADGRLRHWHKDLAFDAETRRRSLAADLLLRQMLSTVQAHAIAGLDAGRVRDAEWRQTALSPMPLPIKDQQPHLFYIPDLPPYSFVEREQLPWAKAFEAQFDAIKAEFTAALPQIETAGRPYLAADLELGADFDAIKGSLNWTALDLYRDGMPNEAVLKHFPKLLAALKDVPLVRIDEHPFEVFFSLLKPHQHIPPHFGLSNHGITVHLPLIVPEGCRFRAADEWREWHEGELLAFDDSFDHEARNDSAALRAVLIFEVWHPGLTGGEIDAVRASFSARDAWLSARRIPKE